MRILLRALALAVAATLPVAAHASPMYPVSGSGGGFSGSGTLVGVSNGDGSYTINSISGTGITGLIGVSGFNGNDNLLFPTGASFLDGSGFAFTDVQGNTSFQVDVFSTGTANYSAYLLDSDGSSMTIPISLTVGSSGSPATSQVIRSLTSGGTGGTIKDFTFTLGTPNVSPTPEPAGLFLLATGMLAMVGVAYRRISKRPPHATPLPPQVRSVQFAGETSDASSKGALHA